MITDQITASLDMIKTIEQQLKEDIINTALSGRKSQNPQFKETSKILMSRRRSAGNLTISKM